MYLKKQKQKQTNCIFNSIRIFPKNQHWLQKVIEQHNKLQIQVSPLEGKNTIILWDTDQKYFIVNIRIWMLLYKVAVDFWTFNLFFKKRYFSK